MNNTPQHPTEDPIGDMFKANGIKLVDHTPDPNGFELQEDGAVTSPTPTGDTDELKLWESMFGNALRAKGSIYTCEYRHFIKLVKAYGDTRYKEGEIDGMEKAKSRVLRRTEIPKDAKNPTRDYIVILGEEIAGFIDGDIAELKQAKKEN